MKKNSIFLFLCLASFLQAEALNVQITSVATIPVSPSDTENVKAVVSAMFTAGGCPLVSSGFYFLNDTIHLTADYQVGLLAVICNTTDTFDLGMLPCTNAVLDVVAVEVGNGTGTDEQFLPLSVSCTTAGIQDHNQSNEFILFPNPVSGNLFLKTQNENLSLEKISVLNLLGETVDVGTEWRTGKDSLMQMDISRLANGIYAIRVDIQGSVWVKRFVKN